MIRPTSSVRLALLVLLGCSSAPAAQEPAEAGGERGPVTLGHAGEHPYDVPFFPGATHDEAVTPPEAILGHAVGARPASHADVLTCWRLWEQESSRVALETYALTYEGRECVVGVVTSPANHARLDEILAGIGRLADRRGVSDGEADAISAASPAVAWLGYSIHGDEMSGVDGGLAVAYHLIAGTGDDVVRTLEELVVVIDPMLNPDGRERILGMLEQSAGAVANLDVDSMHRGRWPWGRGNHYLFDMNRDWMPGIMPETRGRWRMALKYRPQLFVDAHEMGALDTYLFYPQAKPFNPHLPPGLDRWQKLFGDDQAAAFDAYGWSYYTREWADAWGPFYSDAWGSLNGAVGILYEQAGIAGQPLRRASGEVVTYRETAHHQAVSSLANVETLRANRAEVLKSYAAGRAASLEHERAFVLVPDGHAGRERWLVDALTGQGIEVWRHADGFTAQDVVDVLGRRDEQRELPGGALVVPAGQPQGALVRAFLEFDVRMDDEALLEERRELEREASSKVYDVTSWNLARALGVDALWCDGAAALAGAERVTSLEPLRSGAADPQDSPVYGWLVDGRGDDSLAFAVAAMERGLAVHVADRELEAAGRAFARGSLLVRRHENGSDAGARVAAAAEATGVLALGVPSGRAPGEGPDLGGGHLHLLARPRVALLSNSPVAPDRFGHLWHHLDRELGVPTTLIDAQSLGSYDLRRYNVLILPPLWGGGLLAPHAERLRTWVRSGGTLIAMASSASAIANPESELSSVRRRRDVLEDLDEWLFAARREQLAFEIELDPAAVWGDRAEAAPAEASAEGAEDGDPEDKGDPDAEREDAWLRRFSPRGVSVLGLVDDEHWITAGSDRELPVDFAGDLVLFARRPVRTAVRLAPEERLRLGGLLWPEARERMAESSYLTVERSGSGQVILFASQPAFRGYSRATARLFGNAVVVGPGVGASQPLGW